jgi:hypothetical protein
MTPLEIQVTIISALILAMWPFIVRGLQEEWELMKELFREWRGQPK